MNRVFRAIVLPKPISEFERRYLARMNRVGLGFFALHVPVFALIAYVNDTGPLMAILLTLAVMVGPAIAYTTFKNPRTVSMTYGFTAMLMGGLLVHFGQGPIQIEMHFYFFALIAMLAVYANPLVIVVAAVTVALHHLALWAFLPRSVFNYEAPVWVVAVHAAFVVLESVATCFIARSFFDNVIGLEKIVEARTNDLATRNQDMRLVLDHVGQGFLTIDRQGILSQEKSAIVERWLGPAAAGISLADYLRSAAPKFADSFRFGWEQVLEDFLPLELTLDQLPKTFKIGDSCFDVAYTPVMSEGQLDKVVLVVSDVTARVERERLESEQREVLGVFAHIMRDKAGFLEYYEEGNSQVDAILEKRVDDLPSLIRTIHTLKGNSSIFGIHTVATLCHEMETSMVETKSLPSDELLTELGQRWNRLKSNLETLIGDRQRRNVEIEDSEYEAILAAVLSGTPHAEIARRINRWKLEPTQRRLQRISDQARGIAQRLSKGEIAVNIADQGLHLDASAWAPFWSSFVHVVRNAIDHGIELPEERSAKGKSETGSLSLRTSMDGNEFVVEILDDGRGIDWDAVREKARATQIPCETKSEQEEALFRDGITTMSRVTEFSGRGVGMGAVRTACRERGGQVRVQSTPGVGTSVQFRFPANAMAPATFARPNLANPVAHAS